MEIKPDKNITQMSKTKWTYSKSCVKKALSSNGMEKKDCYQDNLQNHHIFNVLNTQNIKLVFDIATWI